MAVKATASVTVFNVSDGADGADGRMLYATCPTAADTTAKVATVSSGTVSLYTGLTVAVQFMHTNTAASPTLNVNGTGAKAIFVNGAGITKSDYWVAGATNTFVYDGARWVMSDVQSVDVDVGGTNIYLGDIADRAVSSNNGSAYPISSSRMADESMGMAYRHVVRSGAGSNNTLIDFYNSTSLSVLSEPLAPGRTYTASCLVRTNCRCANVNAAWTYGYLYSPDLQLLDKVYGPAIQGTGEWERWRMTFTVPEYAGQTGFRILPRTFTFGQGVTWETAYVDLARYKIERGTVATDWSPAPEDVQAGIDAAQGAANAANASVATLEVAADSITQSVDDLAGDVATVATTANEFSVQLQSAIADLTGDIDTNAEAIATVTAMVRVTSDNGRPVLGLGSSGSTLAVQLTNEQLSFVDSGQAVAYINGQRLYITTAEVTGMLRLGNFALVPMSDGSLALKLVG